MPATAQHTSAAVRRFPPDCTPARLQQTLLADGVAVVEGALAPSTLKAIRSQLKPWFEAAHCCQGPLFGRRTRRFGGVLAKAPDTAVLAAHPTILPVIERVLKGAEAVPRCDVIELNLTQAIGIEPGEPAQLLHRDEALWPVELPYEIMANVMWALDDFTEANGATRFILGSHDWPRDRLPAPGEAISVSALAGSAIVWLGGLLHGGGANMSGEIRHGVVISYRLGWLAPTEKLLLSVPPEKARLLPPEVQRLLGYQLHRPNLGWIEGQDPMLWLNGEVGDLASASDNLDEASELRLAAALTRLEYEGYRR